MRTIITQYQTLKSLLPELIEISGYRQDHIAAKLGITAPKFSYKKKTGSWTDDEIERLIAIIDNDATQDLLLLKLLQAEPREEAVAYQESNKQGARK